MASGNGFITYTPDTRYGDGTQVYGASDRAIAQKHTMPGSGSIEIDEIGLYAAYGISAHNAKMAIYTDDSGNNCPESQVSDSLTSAFSINVEDTLTRFTQSYSTKPVLTGGVDYWLAVIADSASNKESIYDCFASGGNAVVVTVTYSTWPTASGWESHTDSSKDFSFYAKYTAEAPASSLPIFDYRYNNMRD